MPQVDECLDNGAHSDDVGPPQDFEGDLYGNDYEEEDFPGFDDPPRLPADSSDDEDVAGNDENGWELELLDQPAGGIGHIRHLLFSTLSIQTGTRVTTDSHGNPPFDSLMIAQIIMQALHWKTRPRQATRLTRMPY